MSDQLDEVRPAAEKASSDFIHTITPATGEPGRTYPAHTIAEARSAAAAAHTAFLDWRRTPFTDRAECLHRAAIILRERKDAFAALMTEEMGKPLAEGRAEIEKCAFHCDWFADHAETYLARQPVDVGGRRVVKPRQSDDAAGGIQAERL